eukprot:TRINITY_DN12498_c0_g1_i2.p1 TRINITY_DN12498_c0_g1~~TRINITY_DN12498_c0_g1_i2.p1  ORF type:complete len:589 (+),score=215.66 TRINITY_DN12498_c0_g1_i2:119-1885(+)
MLRSLVGSEMCIRDSLLDEDSRAHVPEWLAITCLLKIFLDKAYTESTFLDKFFSLAGDTDNDAEDKFKLMTMMYQDLVGKFEDAIEHVHDNSELSSLVLSLMVAKVRAMCDMGDMVQYLQHFLALLEMKLQFLLNKFIDHQISIIKSDSPSASSCDILQAVVQLPLFLEHCVHTSEMVTSFTFLQNQNKREDEEPIDEFNLKPADSWLAQNLLVQQQLQQEAFEAAQQDAAREAIESMHELPEDQEVEGADPEAGVDVDDKPEDKNSDFNVYLIDGMVHKLMVSIFNQIDSIAYDDIRYTNVVLLQNYFRFANEFSGGGVLSVLHSTIAPYTKKAKLMYFTAVDEYVRWLVTCELREAMAYFDEVDALLKSKRQTPQEIHYSHPFKEFKQVVDSCLTQEKICKLLSNIFDKVYDQLCDWLIIACVCQKIEEYFVTQFSKYVEITRHCFPPYMSCFGDLKVEDLRPSSSMYPESKELVAQEMFKLFSKGRTSEKKREIQQAQWLDVDTVNAWYAEAPIDIRKPDGPRRRVKGNSLYAVKDKIVNGATSWSETVPQETDAANDVQEPQVQLLEFEVELDDKQDGAPGMHP